MSLLLQTPRLLINTPNFNDINHWYALHSDPSVMQYMGGVQSRKVIQEWLAHDILHYKKHGFSMGSVFKKGNNEFIGRAGLVYLDHDDTQPDIEIGYVLHKKFWGKGYGVELALTLIDWGFTHLTINKLISVTRPENKKSQHLLEKCGMHYVKTTSFHGSDFLLYEIYKRESY